MGRPYLHNLICKTILQVLMEFDIGEAITLKVPALILTVAASVLSCHIYPSYVGNNKI
jgi:flagellar biosynthesis component FlhA